MSIHYAQGMSRISGALLATDEHLKQSIYDILMTPIGSRLIRRDYGSLLPFLLDEPMTQAVKLKIMSAIATALIKSEPRVKVRQVQIKTDHHGNNSTNNTGFDVLLDLRRADNTRLTTSLTLVRGAS